MSKLNNGPISSNDLMQRLAQAKKIMNKVDSGNFERGHVNENLIMSESEEYVQQDYIPQDYTPSPTRNIPPPTNDRILQSKLPDAIKKAMIENPISQISLNDTIDMDFIKGAKRLIEQENGTIKSTSKQKTTSIPTHSNIDMGAIAILIENTVRKVMDEKLNQLLTAQQTSSINENLVLKVGDSIFKGKITGVNKAK
jgi:hypothetical protein